MTAEGVRSLIEARTRNVEAGISPASIIHSGGMGIPQTINRSTMQPMGSVSTKSSLRNYDSSFLDYAKARGYTGELQTKTPFEKEAELRKVTPVQLLVGGFHYGTYYPSMLATKEGKSVVLPDGTTAYQEPTSRTLRERFYDTTTNIKEWLTRDVTLRDISKSVLGEAEPKSMSDKFFGAIPWIAGIVGAIVLLKVIK